MTAAAMTAPRDDTSQQPLLSQRCHYTIGADLIRFLQLLFDVLVVESHSVGAMEPFIYEISDILTRGTQGVLSHGSQPSRTLWSVCIGRAPPVALVPVLVHVDRRTSVLVLVPR